MVRFQGQIAFEALAAPASPIGVQARGDARRAAAPGLDLWWDARHADFASRPGVLALALGRARDGVPGGTGEAARWLDRYERHGDAAASGVGGGFSVVVIDFAKRVALACIDRFGIEPLCYRSDAASFGFADTACDVPGSAQGIDAQSVFDYLFFHVIPAPRTIHRDVLRLPPAHRLIASRGAARASAHWRPRFVESDRRNPSARKREFVALVQRAVDEEADDASTACFLSGGTDSSTVAGMLTRLRGEPAHAYSIGFAAHGYDEMAYARIAARHFGLVHHEYYVTPDDLVDAIPKVAASLDQPFGNSSVLPAYFCALRARDDGFTRILAGDGGDELFGGNSRYATQQAFELYHAIPQRMREAVLEPLACNWPPLRKLPGLRQVGGYVRHARAAMPERLDAFNLLQFIGPDVLLTPTFMSSVDASAPLAQRRATWRQCDASSLVNRMLAYDWKFTLADSDLPKVRAAAQLANVSVGYPFLGRELTDFSLGLPPDWKVKRFALRWFFKRALADFLPREILRKKKHGFGLPFGAWTLRHAGLRTLAEDSLDAIARRGFLQPASVRSLARERLAEAPAFYGEMVWILMMLEHWLRAHGQHISFSTPSDAVQQDRLIAGASP